jgi:vacuolar-type H+-ATPase subunit I/STV1
MKWFLLTVVGITLIVTATWLIRYFRQRWMSRWPALLSLVVGFLLAGPLGATGGILLQYVGWHHTVVSSFAGITTLAQWKKGAEPVGPSKKDIVAVTLVIGGFIAGIFMRLNGPWY